MFSIMTGWHLVILLVVVVVVILAFVAGIIGIVLLVLRRRPATYAPGEIAGAGSVEERLARLDDLLSRDLITQGEYDARRRSILDSL